MLEQLADSESHAHEQKQWYASLYSHAGLDRNSLRSNRGVLFQTLASEASFVRAFRHIAMPPSKLRVLDVGCGSAGGWYQLIRLGVKPQNITGIEIQPERLHLARELYPQAKLVEADATQIPFEDGCFDVVYESTMFATLADEKLRKAIAAEMVRVCKSNGYLLLVDWRTRKFWDPAYGALTRSDLRRLFAAGTECRIVSVSRGALLPPLGRALSKYASPIYFLVAWLFPFLAGQVTYVLQRQSNTEVRS